MDTRQPANDTERLLRTARSKVEQFVGQGEVDAAHLVLREYPELANDSESAIELIYAEFLALEERGQLPQSDLWLDKFPAHRNRLERLLKLHDFLSAEKSGSLGSVSRDGAVGDRSPEQDVASQPFAKYELIHEVGRGGMGIVYRARQHGLGRIVALKVLRSIENHPKVRQRFQQEAETVASLQHPNIVQVIEISLESGKEFLSMEYLGGGSLESKLPEKSWSNHEMAGLIQTLALAIHYAHERGIIHRDLKPANVLFTTELTPKIVDFGLAKKIQDELNGSVTGGVLGTPCYMSPEQASGNDSPIGISTDIYSLGVILYQMLTKKLPFEGKTAIETLRWIVDRECDPPSKWIPSVPRDLETICLKCLAKSPSDRYATAKELADDLARFLDHLPIRARRAGWLELAGRKIKRHPQVAALAASIVVVGVGASTLLYFQNQTVDQLARENAQHVKSKAELRERVTQAETAYEESLSKARASVKEWTQLGVRLDNDPGMDGLRRKAFEDAFAYYREVVTENDVDDAIRFEAAIAAIQAAYFHADIGEYKTAEAELRTAGQWLDVLPLDEKVKLYKADVQVILANILRRTDRWDESQKSYESAITMGAELLKDAPNNTNYLIRQSNALVNLCVVYKFHGKWDESLKTYLQAMTLSTKAATIRTKRTVPDFLTQASTVELHELPKALDRITEYLSTLCQELKERDPALLTALASENYLPEIALCLDDAGQVFENRSQIALAEKSYREAIRLRKLTQTLSQKNRRIDQFLARGETNLGKLLFDNNRYEESRISLDVAYTAYEKLVADFPERMDYRTEWSSCLMTLAKCSCTKENYRQAAQYAEQAAVQLQFAAKHANSIPVQDGLARCLFAHSYFLGLAGEEKRSIDVLKKAKEIAKDRFGPLNSHAWMLALEDGWHARDQEVALELSAAATQLSPQAAYLWNTRALVLARAGKWSESLTAVDKAMELQNGGTPSDWFIKAMALAGNGDMEGARQWFAKAESARSANEPNHAELRRQARLAEALLYPAN
jgi:tetratricopeptide (TPR) repeat protein